VLPEGVGFIEQDQLVPLGALGLVNRQGIAVGELIGFPPQDEGQILVAALEERLMDGDIHRFPPDFVFGLHIHADEVVLDAAQGLDGPGAAVQQALGLVVAQADELFARRRHGAAVAAQLAQARIVRTPGLVEADQNLVRLRDLRGIDVAAANDAAFAIGPEFQPPPFPHLHRHVHDRIVPRLAMHLR
jgi:hypothetical protein